MNELSCFKRNLHVKTAYFFMVFFEIALKTLGRLSKYFTRCST